MLDVEDLDASVPVTVVTRRGGYLGAAAQALLDELRSAAGSVTPSTVSRPAGPPP